jgi:hypothetical protein
MLLFVAFDLGPTNNLGNQSLECVTRVGQNCYLWFLVARFINIAIIVQG